LCFGLGIIITIAEPDLAVLAGQLDRSLSGELIVSVANALGMDVRIVNQWIIILSVALGVGVFLVMAYIRSRKGIKLNTLLLIFYGIILCLALFVPKEFVPTSFDSGGVTTGPITVPFIMALGAGIASISTSKNARENSFGLIALCSIGPILSVLILSVCFKAEGSSSATEINTAFNTSSEAFNQFTKALPHYAEEVAMACPQPSEEPETVVEEPEKEVTDETVIEEEITEGEE
jgi:hypothetical protein